MVSTRQAFSSLNYSNGPNILFGDNSETESKGKGSIYFDHGSFNNVMYVPTLAALLLSVYQMTHTGSPKKVFFTPNDADILNVRVTAKFFVDHSQKVCEFSHLMPFYNPSSILPHANEAIKIWHDRFGHINY